MLWKCLGGRIIYCSEHLSVYDNYFYRWLKFNSSAYQSLLNINSPTKPALNYVKALSFAACKLPGHTCMLGLGGAGVAHTLAPFIKDYSLTAVELSPEVIKIANQYFMADRIKNMVILQQDASHYIKSTEQHFSHLLIDLANDNAFPDSCSHDEFFKSCKAILKPQGILAINVVNTFEYNDIFHKLKKQFSNNIITLPVLGCTNLIFLATFNDNFKMLISLFESSREIKRLVWDKKWGYMADLKFNSFR